MKVFLHCRSNRAILGWRSVFHEAFGGFKLLTDLTDKRLYEHLQSNAFQAKVRQIAQEKNVTVQLEFKNQKTTRDVVTRQVEINAPDYESGCNLDEDLSRTETDMSSEGKLLISVRKRPNDPRQRPMDTKEADRKLFALLKSEFELPAFRGHVWRLPRQLPETGIPAVNDPHEFSYYPNQ